MVLDLPLLRIDGIRVRSLLLGGFSLVSILALFLLYGRSDPSEVLYAQHKA